MKLNHVVGAAMGGALLLSLTVGAGTASVPAGPLLDRPPATIAYEIVELDPAEGGTAATPSSINDRRWVTGTSELPGVVHATLWRRGEPDDLGTLGGPNSAVLWPNKDTDGLVVGVAETRRLDPRGEQWSCSAFFPTVTGHVCRGFVWEDGRMRALSTFGGTHGFAAGANDRGQVVGWAETRQEDPSCVGRDQELQFLAAIWDTRRDDRIQRLRPLPGPDSVSSATAINDRGQVVGISGSCDQAVGRFSARAAVLWNPGRSRPIDLGNLGDEAWNTPMAINDRGLVVGFANAADSENGVPNVRPFRWTRWGGIDDLGTLDDDPNGQALGVNDDGIIVGFSRAAPGVREHREHAVIWRHGDIVDLNDLAPGYDGHLRTATDINDDGVITGSAVNADGQSVGFVATPVDDCDRGSHP